MPWLIIFILLAVVALVGVWVLMRGHDEQQRKGSRSQLTAFGVWVVYILYTGATVVAVWIELWSWPTPPILGWIIGGAFIVFGIWFCGWGMASFKSFNRISGTDTDKLITSGAYRYSRNPQNTGWGIMLIGIAVAGHSLAALLLAGIFWLVFALYVRYEEQFLHQTFGETYESFCQSTPRFFGRPIRSQRS